MKGSWDSITLILITLTFLFLFRDVFAAPARHLCHPEQRDALLEFKNEFKIQKPCSSVWPPRPPKTVSWSNSNDCCSWDGIICHADYGDVIELNLSDSCLHGQLNSRSTIFRLLHLRFLDLSGNNFVGEIPASFGNLSKLTTLNLSKNDFTGKIPSSLGYLLNLIQLVLCANNFVGEIPSSLENLSQLTFLSLCENKFSGEILSKLGNFSHLTDLDLSQNNFVGEIPSAFGRLNNLTDIYIENNKFSGNFPLTLLNLTKLSHLSLSGNKFTGTLPPNISLLSNLVCFYVNYNAFFGTLPSSLFTIPCIDLSDNQFNGTLEFGNISSSSKILELPLNNNNFVGSIPRSISKLVNLYRLELSHFNTQGPVDFSIFSHLKLLEELSLSHLNTTTTIDLDAIFSSFKSLNALDLSGNHVSVTNKSIVSDPPLLDRLNLSGCGITEFPEILKTQHRMTYLDISNNKIEGQVPGWLWMLPVLEYVNLSNNKIKGQVPGWLWMLPVLKYVNLSNNTFIGFERLTKPGLSSVTKPSMRHLFGSNNNFIDNIPSFICAFSSLETLDLSNNKFNGSIPRCMVNLSSSLEALNLRHNHLSGILPEIVFKSLSSLDVGHNQLVGKLPRSLIRNSFLEVLNVESNRISDTFPFWLSSLQELQVLVLRSNAFHGPIEQTRFSKLRIIDISRNHFNGNLPSDFFVNWTAMFSLGKSEDKSNDFSGNGEYMGTTYYSDSVVLMNKGVEMELVRILKIYTAIDFSGNEFEEEIPRSIGLLKELHVLNLSNNAFTGHIPSSMGNLTALESLDVSQNKLLGEIPQELGHLSFLAYMNFSHNQLVGLVPGGTQFRRQPCSSFKYNPGLYGPSLDEVCLDIHATTSQQSETPEEDEEEVMSWIAAAIGFIPGITFGFTMGYILISYKSELFINAFGRNKRRNISTTAHKRAFLNPG